MTITNPLVKCRCAALLAVTLCLGGAAFAQQYTPPPPPLTTAPCVPTKKEPCTLPPVPPPPAQQKFAFPGDPAPGDKPAAPTDGSAPPTSGNFAFPGEPDEKPAPPMAGAKGFAFPDESSSSSSSSSSSNPGGAEPDAEPDQPALADKGSTGSTRAQRRHLAKVEDTSDREAKDLEVAHYYATTGNFQASYMRAKDAVATVPQDPLAHFAVAEAARSLKKNDEAIAEYKAYLKLDPEGDKAKASEHALDLLAAK